MTPFDELARLFASARTAAFHQWLVESRRFPVGLLDRVQAGWSPESDLITRPRRLTRALTEAGFLTATGSPEKRYTGRIVVPERDGEGRVTGFLFRINPLARPAGMETEAGWSVMSTRSGLSFFPGQLDTSAPYRPAPDDRSPEVTVVEGPADAWRCLQAGLPDPHATKGKENTGLLLTRLARRPGLRRVTVMLDWDPGGRVTALSVASSVLRQPPPFEVLMVPADNAPDETDDPADVDPETLQHLYGQAVPPRPFIDRMLELGLDLSSPWQRQALARLRSRSLSP